MNEILFSCYENIMENTKNKTLFLWSYLWRDMDFFNSTHTKTFGLMTKDEALKIAVRLLSKLMSSDNGEAESIAALASIHMADADKDYDKIFFMLEEMKEFIIKLQNGLKNK